MDPSGSPYIMSNNSPHNAFLQSLLRTRQKTYLFTEVYIYIYVYIYAETITRNPKRQVFSGQRQGLGFTVPLRSLYVSTPLNRDAYGRNRNPNIDEYLKTDHRVACWRVIYFRRFAGGCWCTVWLMKFIWPSSSRVEGLAVLGRRRHL